MIRYLIWLQQALGAGSCKAIKALEHFGSAEALFKSGNEKRAKSKIFTKRELERLEAVTLANSLSIMAECKKDGIEIIPYGSEKYPFCLSVIPDAPLVLYVKGNIPRFDDIPTICIVGPRKVSEFGKKAAFSLGYRLAASGIIVVSGGALGTDTYAHAGALKAGGTTVLCLGCGINSSYLPENKNLRKAVFESGCLISEYPPSEDPNRYTFPVRNRIMAALSLGTVVVEAGKKSGALITARHANEQGRDVFVIPGSPEDSKYAGSNLLLRDGARPLLDVSDIFNEYILRFPDKINIEKALNSDIIGKNKQNVTPKKPVTEKKTENSQKILPETLSKEAKIVYNYLNKQIFLPEEIGISNMDNQQLLSALTELEMEFLIKALPGGRYEKL